MTSIYDSEPEDWRTRLKAQEIHMICVAAGGLTSCDHAAATVCGLDQREEIWPVTLKANEAGTTATFFPRLTLTVIPQIIWNNRPKPADEDAFLKERFQEVAQINCEIIRSNTLYVDLNGLNPDCFFESARRYAEEALLLKARRIAEESLSASQEIEEIFFAPKWA